MNKKSAFFLVILFSLMMSLPWLVPHMGVFALVAFVPLLCLDYIAEGTGRKHFFFWYFGAFLLWNAATTFWICNATVGGAIGAVLFNSLMMSAVWALFRISRKKWHGILPYVFLAVAWMAWERFYFHAQISWPWLALGNAFAQSTSMVQWYEVTGLMGGSLWVWLSNLGIFAILISVASGRWIGWKSKTRVGLVSAVSVVILGPIVASELRYATYREDSTGQLDVVIGQPGFDPYRKYESMTQSEQNTFLLNLYDGKTSALPGESGHLASGALVRRQKNAVLADSTLPSAALPDTLGEYGPHRLYLAPECFTNDVWLNDIRAGETVRDFTAYLHGRYGSEILFGSSTYEMFCQHSKPHILARDFGRDMWYENRNSAILLDRRDSISLYHKSRLVIGTELTPFPKLLVPLDDKLGGVMGRCIGQDEVSLFMVRDSVPIGCAICYESIYPEHCASYSAKGAQALAVITNDAWWGNTPGYRQHFSYSRLRAIEARKHIARSANTGISAIIDSRGDVVKSTDWWTPSILEGKLQLNNVVTPFVRFGDIVGKAATLAFLLLAAWLAVSLFVRRDWGDSPRAL